MSTPVNIQLAYKDSAWFAANPTVILKYGQHVYLSDGADEFINAYCIGDGVTTLDTLPWRGLKQNLQEVTDEGNTTANAIDAPQFNTSGGEVTITTAMVEVLDSANTAPLFRIDRSDDTVKYNNAEVATNGEGTAIASASVVDLGIDGNSLYHITGSTTITSFSNLAAGIKKTLVFDAAPLITNSANIILPGNANIQTAANDTIVLIGEGLGVVRCVLYQPYSDSYTSYTPTITGCSSPPTFAANDARWKMLTRNTYHLQIRPSAAGTSNATTKTITLPFVFPNIGTLPSVQQCLIVNSGTAAYGHIICRLGSNIADIYPSAGSGNWTASGGFNVVINCVLQSDL